MGRRENGAGTKILQEANGRWSQKISYRDPVTDKPKRTTIRGASQNEVKAKVKDFKKSIEQGVKPNKAICFEEWLDKWLVTYKTDIASNTLENYQFIIKKIKGTELGQTPINRVQRQQIQEFINKLGETLSPGTQRLFRVVIAGAFKTAVLDSLIVRNPCIAIKTNSKTDEELVRPFTDEELKRIFLVAPNYLRNIIAVSLYTGMRIGEVCGLAFSNISFDKNELLVNQQVTRTKVDNTYKVKVTTILKTKSSRRRITLCPLLKNLLANLPKQSEQDLVFLRDDGTPYNGSMVSQIFGRLLTKLNIENHSFHDLRHTFASVAIKKGLSIVALSSVLGHAKASTTLDVYGHLMPGDNAQIVNTVAEFYDKSIGTFFETVNSKRKKLKVIVKREKSSKIAGS